MARYQDRAGRALRVIGLAPMTPLTSPSLRLICFLTTFFEVSLGCRSSPKVQRTSDYTKETNRKRAQRLAGSRCDVFEQKGSVKNGAKIRRLCGDCDVVL